MFDQSSKQDVSKSYGLTPANVIKPVNVTKQRSTPWCKDLPLLKISKEAFGERITWCADYSLWELSISLSPRYLCSKSEAAIFKEYGQGLLQGYPQHEPLGTQLFCSNCLFLAATAFPACKKVHFLTEVLLIYWVAGKRQFVGVVKELQLQCPIFPTVTCSDPHSVRKLQLQQQFIITDNW